MKRVIALLVMLLMVFSVAACGSQSAESPKSDAEEATAAKEEINEEKAAEAAPAEEWVDKSAMRYLDREYETTEDGRRIIKLYYCVDAYQQVTSYHLDIIQKRCEEINAERDDIFVELIGYSDGQGKIDKQIADVEAAIMLNPDVIFINAVDSSAIIPACEAAYNAGIYVIENRGSKTEKVDLHLKVSDEDLIGRRVAEIAENWHEQHPDEICYVGVILGNLSQTEQLKRDDGLVKLDAETDWLKIVASQNGDWTADSGMKLTEDYITAHPELNFLYCANDPMALGASQALKASGLTEDVYLVSNNGTYTDVELMEKGEVDAIVGNAFRTMFSNVVDASVSLVMGDLMDLEGKVYPAGNVHVVVYPENLEWFKTEVSGLFNED